MRAITQKDWAAILQAKEAINKVIEEQRSQGVIKGSLGADIEVSAGRESACIIGQAWRRIALCDHHLESDFNAIAQFRCG